MWGVGCGEFVQQLLLSIQKSLVLVLVLVVTLPTAVVPLGLALEVLAGNIVDVNTVVRTVVCGITNQNLQTGLKHGFKSFKFVTKRIMDHK